MGQQASMTQSVCNIVKAPLGWSINCDDVKLVFGSKESAFEAVTVAATFAVRDGAGVSERAEADEIPGNWISAIK
jgi:hypothetical protein